MDRRRALRACVVPVAAVLMLPGCGFELRQTPTFAFHTLYLKTNPNSPLAVEMRRYLKASDVRVLTAAADLNDADVQLEILGDQRIKTVLAYNASGLVREFALKLVLRFRLSTPKGKELLPMTELAQQRFMSYDEAYALSKEAEENLLYANMQSDMVQQILRRIAVVKEL